MKAPRTAAARSFTLVTQYYPPERGAAQVRLGSIVAELVRRGARTTVVTALPNYPVGRIFDGWSKRPLQTADEGGARVIRVWVWASMGSGLRRIANYASFGVMSMVGMLRGRPADWTIVEYPTLFGALPTVLWCRLRHRRVVVIVADLWIDSIVALGVMGDGAVISVLRWWERWMLRNADAVTAVTEGVRDAVRAKGVRADRLVWLPNGVDTDMFSPGPFDEAVRRELGLADGDQYVLYAGTHGMVHGLDVVLDAARLLEGEAVRFVLVGSGSEKDALRDRARREGIANVTFLDPVAPEAVARLLRGALAGLATVRSGDLYRTVRSTKMFPTMATGRPVIYSADDEGSRLVAELHAGIVTEPGDGAALAEAVRTLLGDPGLGDRLGTAGRRWTVENASWTHLVGDWLGQLDALGALRSAQPEAAATADGGLC